MKHIRRDIEIGASAERVWGVLTNFAAYSEWNPFVRSIAGEARPGARLRVRIEPPGGRAMTFRPTVLAAEPGHELRWLGRFLLPRMFDGEHALLIEPLADATVRFVQQEEFRGLLVPLLSRALDRTAEGFEQMNQALKARVEQL